MELAIFRRACAIYKTPDHTVAFQNAWNALEDDVHALHPSCLADLRVSVALYLKDRDASWDLRVGAMVLDTMLDY